MNDSNPVTSSERAGMVAAIIVVAVAVLVMWVWQVCGPAPGHFAGEDAVTVPEVSVTDASTDTTAETPVKTKRKKKSRNTSPSPAGKASVRNPLDEPVEGF